MINNFLQKSKRHRLKLVKNSRASDSDGWVIRRGLDVCSNDRNLVNKTVEKFLTGFSGNTKTSRLGGINNSINGTKKNTRFVTII